MHSPGARSLNKVLVDGSKVDVRIRLTHLLAWLSRQTTLELHQSSRDLVTHRRLASMVMRWGRRGGMVSAAVGSHWSSTTVAVVADAVRMCLRRLRCGGGSRNRICGLLGCDFRLLCNCMLAVSLA